MLDETTARRAGRILWTDTLGLAPTNRNGAFYVDGLRAGGVVIDAECLDASERKTLSSLLPSIDLDGCRILYAEEDLDWPIPVLVAGIAIPNNWMTPEAARKRIADRTDLSNHLRLRLLEEAPSDA